MDKATNDNSTNLPGMSADQVRHLAGPVSDHTIMEILGETPIAADLEVAVTYARGEGDVADRVGHALSGKSARIYDILMADDVYQVEER